MSEKLLKFLLSDLDLIRVRCRKCGSAVEIKVDNVVNAKEIFCPGCPDPRPVLQSTAAGHVNHLGAMASAILKLKQLKDVEIEFVIPDNG
jgi:hypothetical protein